METMEDNTKLIEILLEKIVSYSKTSYDLAKLRALDKTSEVVSSFLPHYIVFVAFAFFILFSGLGLAFWLGEILGKAAYGFFAVAAFYAIVGIVIHLFMHKWLKKIIGNSFINQVFK
jgi:hypothetical protein